MRSCSCLNLVGSYFPLVWKSSHLVRSLRSPRSSPIGLPSVDLQASSSLAPPVTPLLLPVPRDPSTPSAADELMQEENFAANPAAAPVLNVGGSAPNVKGLGRFTPVPGTEG